MDVDLSQLELTKPNANILSFLLRSGEEYDEFVQKYWQGKGKQGFAVSSFRLDRLRKNMMRYEDFYDLYQSNKRNALETLFQHPVTNQDVQVLEEKISQGRVTLTTLYVKHQREMSLPLHRLIL